MRVVDHGAYVMGPEVIALEKGARRVLRCEGSGELRQRRRCPAPHPHGKQLKPGDAVFCPAFTFASTASTIVRAGAVAGFIDVHAETFNSDARSLEAGIRTAKEQGLRPVGVIPVDLFGLAADYDAITPVCEEHGLWMLADAAQSFGGTYKGRKIGTLGFGDLHLVLPGQAARSLWRRRCHLHR